MAYVTPEALKIVESSLTACGWTPTSNILGGGHEWQHINAQLISIRVTPDGVVMTLTTPPNSQRTTCTRGQKNGLKTKN